MAISVGLDDSNTQNKEAHKVKIKQNLQNSISVWHWSDPRLNGRL